MSEPAQKQAVEAARYFREEVLEIMPDIPRDELSRMVGEYVYYHQVETTKSDAFRAVEMTCLQPAQ